jgi:GxxExxY protein
MEGKMGDKITEKIIGAAIEVHKILGPGLLETIYEEALCYEFELQNIQYNRQVDIDVVYKDRIIRGQKLDLIVADEVVVEIKSLRHLPEVAIAQILSYLKATDLNRGLLINFGEKRLVNGIKRISL